MCCIKLIKLIFKLNYDINLFNLIKNIREQEIENLKSILINELRNLLMI